MRAVEYCVTLLQDLDPESAMPTQQPWTGNELPTKVGTDLKSLGTLRVSLLNGVGNPRDRVSESFHRLLKFQR